VLTMMWRCRWMMSRMSRLEASLSTLVRLFFFLLPFEGHVDLILSLLTLSLSLSLSLHLRVVDAIYGVAIHPEFQDIAATGGGDDRAFIWKISTGERLFELTGHTDSIIAVAFSSTGKYLATGSMDGTAKIWESETGKLTATLEGPNEIIVPSLFPFPPILRRGVAHCLSPGRISGLTGTQRVMSCSRERRMGRPGCGLPTGR